ncbi:Dephospho-CoA kinase [Microbacterium lemovicicum]|uniref:Dephospho-CoA kinase n=1 Tax=Microbacterium lemovicicum TaxID=1072463 RepID=A0A3S9W950_9MICO|nr:dephospho-CoA kinase [Microbacterium lemovicicum]AZS36611.1 Dephospho-CoA kinase [Microbacterium lemovicicum]
MSLIALTGGIASGKSTIARRLAEHGAVIVDADQIVRDVQAPGSPVLGRIAAEFGDEVIQAGGSLDRAALGGLVFGNPDKLARLNAIVHPAVREESTRRFAVAAEADPDGVVVYDVPLLAESRAHDPWELVVVAHAPAEVRVGRLVSERGMTEAQARARVASQATDADRLALADVVIDTAGTMADTLRQVDELWERMPRLLAARA